MGRTPKAVVLFAILFSSISIYAQVATIKGKVLNAEGKPPVEAIVGIENQSTGNLTDVVKVDAEGNYVIKVTKPGEFILGFCSPEHSPIKVPLVNFANRELIVNVNMAHYKYVDTFDEVKVMGTINGFVSIRDALPLQKQADGTYSNTFNSKEKEILYQIVGVERSRSINGTEGIRFEPDYSGDYYSVLPVKDGIAKIVFDPMKLKKGGNEQKVVIKGSEFDDKYAELNNQYKAAFNDAMVQMYKWGKEKPGSEFIFNSGHYITDLATFVETTRDPYLQKLAKLYYLPFSGFNTLDYNKEKAAKWYESIPLTDPLWETNLNSVFACRALFNKEKAEELEKRFVDESKSEIVVAHILGNELTRAFRNGNIEELSKLRELVKTNYSSNKTLQEYLKNIPFDAAIAIGKQIPDYEAASLDNPAEKFSKKSMLGKIYMIDFWATWCGPCVSEMASIHKAYNKFQDKGFEIVSLSMDQGTKEITKFRKEKFPMPWKNAYINDAEGKKISEKFGVKGIPMPILVSSTGEVLAMDESLRGVKLEETLAKYFSGEK